MRPDSMMAAILRGEQVHMHVGNDSGCGMRSEVDGKTYNNGKEYDKHLAEHGLARTSAAENKSKSRKLLDKVREDDARTRAAGDTGGCDPARLERLRAGLRD